MDVLQNIPKLINLGPKLYHFLTAEINYNQVYCYQKIEATSQDQRRYELVITNSEINAKTNKSVSMITQFSAYYF